MIAKISPRALGIVAFVTGAIALCFLVLPYVFFPQFYIPKANSSMGYTAPATIEGWVFMILGFCLLIVTIILRIQQKRQ
jgi:hypothetical protein